MCANCAYTGDCESGLECTRGICVDPAIGSGPCQVSSDTKDAAEDQVGSDDGKDQGCGDGGQSWLYCDSDGSPNGVSVDNLGAITVTP